MANSNTKVIIPKNAEEIIKLAKAINAKHVLDGLKSPLNSMEDYKWEVEGPKLSLAQAKHDEAEELKKKMEAAYRERDLILSNTTNIIRATRDILLGVNRQNAKRLGEWGFTVEG